MREDVQDYYGKVLSASNDLQTNACCTMEAPPGYIKSILSQIHDEPMSKYYGCGLVVPEALRGLNILDLGCGAGRDCFLLSSLVGESGFITGIDMTPEQLEVAERYIGFHQEAWGYKQPNINFIQGDLDALHTLDLPLEKGVDLIVSNCVINLCQDKEAVLSAAYNLLRPGGEMYFSDVYSSRRIPKDLVNDPVLYGECLSGALYWNDFLSVARRVGFNDPRLVKDQPITIENESLKEKTGTTEFYSGTYRLFKIPELEYSCEDYGQAVVYKGTIEHHPNYFMLDKHHIIEKDKIFPVCGNTYQMLKQSRFSEYFEFYGTWDTHYGVFEGCGLQIPFNTDNKTLNCC